MLVEQTPENFARQYNNGRALGRRSGKNQASLYYRTTAPPTDRTGPSLDPQWKWRTVCTAIKTERKSRYVKKWQGGMSDEILQFEIVETKKTTSERTFTALVDAQTVQRCLTDFDATAASFWFRFFGEVDFHAGNFEGLTDVTLELSLSDDARELADAASALARLSNRTAWGQHVAMLGSAKIDAIYIKCEDFRADEVFRPLQPDEAQRLESMRAAFSGMLLDGDPDAQSDLVTKIVMDLLVGEYEGDARGALATIVGVWLGDRVAELTDLEWHCVEDGETVTFCIHNPVRKISCFPFDALNKRINAREAFKPDLLAATFAEALAGGATQ